MSGSVALRAESSAESNTTDTVGGGSPLPEASVGNATALHTGIESEHHNPSGILMFGPRRAGQPPRCPKCQNETRPHCRGPGCRWWRCDHCGMQGGRLIKGIYRWVDDKPQKTP
jgi:hypothetical protein